MNWSRRTLWGRLARIAALAALARVGIFAATLLRARRVGLALPAPDLGDSRAPALLLLGDSIAAGIGAASPAQTIAAQLAADFPGFGVECRARAGARTRDLPLQLSAAARPRYAAIIISIGGNDILRVTPMIEFSRQLAFALALCRQRAGCLIVANCANLGGAPLFFWPWSVWLDSRSLRIRQVMIRQCAAQQARFVNFCLERDRDIFRCDPERFFSGDGIHPSGYAYRLCYLYLVKAGGLEETLRIKLAHALAGTGICCDNDLVPQSRQP